MARNNRVGTKRSSYTFRVDEECKSKFQIYCKMMKVSPSDVLIEVMKEFNDNAEQIIQMKDISELQEMFHQKVQIGQREIDTLKAEKKQQLDSGAEVLSNAGYEKK